MSARNGWLLAGGASSLAASALHVAAIAGGSRWYRFIGAGEGMARAVERGETRPAVITFAIAAVLAVWGVYGLAGAGVLPRPPLMRTALVLISAAYLLRGFVLFAPGALRRPDLSASFLFWSSLIVFAIGLLYAIGTWRAWPTL